MKKIIAFIAVVLTANVSFANINIKGNAANDDVVNYLKNEFSKSSNATVADLENKTYTCQSYSAVKDTYVISNSDVTFNLVFPNILAQWNDRVEQFRPLSDGSLTFDDSDISGTYRFSSIRISKSNKLYIESGDSIPGAERDESVYKKGIFSNSYATCNVKN